MDTSATPQSRVPVPAPIGSFDGDGAGDHDEPYQFGRRPRASSPFPFTERQYARLLILRSRAADTGVMDRPVELRVIRGGKYRAAA